MPLRLLFAILSLSLVAAACGSDTGDVALEAETAGEVTEELRADLQPVESDESADNTDENDSESAKSASGNGYDTPPPALAVGADATFKSAVSSAAVYRTGQFEGRLTMTVGDTGDQGEPVEMAIFGSYDNPAQAVDMSIDMSSVLGAAMASDDGTAAPGLESFFSEPLRIVVIGDESWMQWSLFSMFSGQADAWLSATPEELDASGDELGLATGISDPTALLDGLVDADAAVTEIGTESVRGVATTHWLATIDAEALSAQLDATEQADLESQVGSLDNGELPLQLWVGIDDGLLYRYQITVPSVGDEGESGETTIMFEFYDHGAPVTIEAPPADQVIAAEGILFN